MAEATNAQILAFNVKVLGHAVEITAKDKNVEIHQHTVIYHLLDTVGQSLLDRAPLCEDEQVLGEALVQQIFNIKCKQYLTQRTPSHSFASAFQIEIAFECGRMRCHFGTRAEIRSPVPCATIRSNSL